MTIQEACVFVVCCAGPEFWGLVNTEWYICTKGRRQSPINIDPLKLLFDPSLRSLRIDKHRVRLSLLDIVNISCHTVIVTVVESADAVMSQ